MFPGSFPGRLLLAPLQMDSLHPGLGTSYALLLQAGSNSSSTLTSFSYKYKCAISCSVNILQVCVGKLCLISKYEIRETMQNNFQPLRKLHM